MPWGNISRLHIAVCLMKVHAVLWRDIDDLERRGRLSGPVNRGGSVSSNSIGNAISSILRVCSVTCKTQEGPCALGSSLLYFPGILSVGEVTIGRWSPYTNCPIENSGIVQIFRSNFIIPTLSLA